MSVFFFTFFISILSHHFINTERTEDSDGGGRVKCSFGNTPLETRNGGEAGVYHCLYPSSMYSTAFWMEEGTNVCDVWYFIKYSGSLWGGIEGE